MSKLIVNVETGEEVLRELTDDELAQELKEQAANAKFIEAQRKADEAKAAARQAILDRLGLTEEEARLLLG